MRCSAYFRVVPRRAAGPSRIDHVGKEANMPATIRIIHAHDFIKANSNGQLDLEASKQLLTELASAVAALVDYGVLLDTRKSHSELSVTDLWYLVAELSNHFREAFSRSYKTAVLCPLERFDHAEFFALCAKNRGFNVRAFTSVEDAHEWLLANRA
jgi:hypothetical protein